jgi:SAM-dependent methyltransferase
VSVDTILESLSPDQLVLDLGSGHGSFQYSKYNSRILAIDVAFDATPRLVSPDRILYARGDSQALPLASGTIDFAVCNHSLEHVARIRETLAELARVLKPDGFLWISVPNGFGFDDALYRLLYDGGGHVNRFSFEGLKSAVESNGLRPRSVPALTNATGDSTAGVAPTKASPQIVVTIEQRSAHGRPEHRMRPSF